MLALCYLRRKPYFSCTKSSVPYHVKKAKFFRHNSILLIAKECFGKIKLSNNLTWFVKRVHSSQFQYKSFLFKQHCIVQVLTMIFIISKLLSTSFKSTLGFILTSWHSFHAVLGDNLAFLQCPDKFCQAKLFKFLYNRLYHWNLLTGPVSLSLSLTCCINTLVRSVLLWNNKCNNNADITPFIPVLAGWNLPMSQTLSHQRRDAWPINCTPKDGHASIFSILPVLHTQDTFVLILNFEVGHFACHFLLLSFFLLVLLWKEFNPYSFVVTFHFSHSFGSPPVFFFYPAMDSCWIHVNIGCSACIYSMLHTVSLNDKPRLAHQMQQSAGSAFQLHYNHRSRDG